MNSKDREYFDEKFGKVYERLDKHGNRLTCLETKWKMATKFFALTAGAVSLAISTIVAIFWR